MSYFITFWSPIYFKEAGKKTVRIETAAEAWAEVRGLIASDETVEIVEMDGHAMTWRELRAAAERESQ